jgi:hypothetical protein
MIQNLCSEHMHYGKWELFPLVFFRPLTPFVPCLKDSSEHFLCNFAEHIDDHALQAFLVRDLMFIQVFLRQRKKEKQLAPSFGVQYACSIHLTLVTRKHSDDHVQIADIHCPGGCIGLSVNFFQNGNRFRQPDEMH